MQFYLKFIRDLTINLKERASLECIIDASHSETIEKDYKMNHVLWSKSSIDKIEQTDVEELIQENRSIAV